MSKRLWPAVLSLALVGCVHVNKSVLAPNPTGRTFAVQGVTVFIGSESQSQHWPRPCLGCEPAPIENGPIPQHERVALLKAKGDWGLMINKLREEAGKLGANAIILGAIKKPGFGEYFVAGIGGCCGADNEYQAIAIYAPSLDVGGE